MQYSLGPYGFVDSACGKTLPAAYDSEAIGAPIPSMTIITPTEKGTWLLDVWARVVQSASGGHPGPSSTIGPLTLNFIHDNVPMSLVVGLFNETGTAVVSNSGNVTTSVLTGSAYLASDATPINFSFGYASHGTVPMLAHLHIKIVFVGILK